MKRAIIPEFVYKPRYGGKDSRVFMLVYHALWRDLTVDDGESIDDTGLLNYPAIYPAFYMAIML